MSITIKIETLKCYDFRDSNLKMSFIDFKRMYIETLILKFKIYKGGFCSLS